MRRMKRKTKINPNIQHTGKEKRQRADQEVNGSGSDSDEVMVSYKSNRSAMPSGPQDQGATAVLVRVFFC